MKRKTVNLFDVHQTGAEMRRLTCLYCGDLGEWLAVPFLKFYRHVCDLPYVPDPVDVETVSRPCYTLDVSYGPRDCDDKSVLLASWLHAHGEPLRFVASSTRPDKMLHHVFLQMKNGLFLDGTYAKNRDFVGFYPYFTKITRLEPLTLFF